MRPRVIGLVIFHLHRRKRAVGVEQQYWFFLFEDFVSQKEPNVRWNLFCSDFPTVKRLANEIGIRHSDLSQMAIRPPMPSMDPFKVQAL
jgi:hypothetical protein